MRLSKKKVGNYKNLDILEVRSRIQKRVILLFTRKEGKKEDTRQKTGEYDLLHEIQKGGMLKDRPVE
ncbi:hypothetical protein K1719_044330 [Acacia pycnantha]|nr:hypothetical protein K1719_044330 [Acacia pycnantha]